MVAWRRRLLDNPDPSWRAKFVALGLSVYWDGEGRGAWPSVETLARALKISKTTVQRGLAELKERGIVDWEERPGRVTTYHAAPISLEPRAVSDGRAARSEGLLDASQVHPTPVTRTPKEVTEEATQGVTEEADQDWIAVYDRTIPKQHELGEESSEEKQGLSVLELLQDERFREWLRIEGWHSLESVSDFGDEVVSKFGVTRRVVAELREVLLRSAGRKR